MPGTMFAQSLYGTSSGGASGQDMTNAKPGTAKTATAVPGNASSATWGSVPVLPGISVASGVPVPMLVGMGVLAWWLFRQY